jgi:peptidoglycan LD-endopeptidase CwlK
MPTFGERSRKALDSADPKLRLLFDEVIKTVDCSVLCGYRNEADQEAAFAQGFSKVHWPDSKHNNFPSRAVDVVPCPLDWKETRRFYFFAGYVKATADRLGIKVRWGGDFNQDGNLTNDNFVDLPHYELVEGT